MTDARKIPGTEQAWDDGELGADAKHARVASSDRTQAVDKALGLKAISIRLPESIIEDFKFLAEIEGMGYQPLMREALIRFATSESKRQMRNYASALRERGEAEPAERKADRAKQAA